MLHHHRRNGQFGGKNIGDLLNAKGVTWGFFEGGFDLTLTNANGTHRLHAQHHFVDHQHQKEPTTFRITSRSSTTCRRRTHPTQRPSSVTAIGTDSDAANHQYDIA